jgi:hypothetical protein
MSRNRRRALLIVRILLGFGSIALYLVAVFFAQQAGLATGAGGENSGAASLSKTCFVIATGCVLALVIASGEGD